MFVFNSKTTINKVFEIKELSKVIQTDKGMKEELKLIDKIVLEHVLSKDTLNIESDENCQEIYIFGIHMKERELPIQWIKALDHMTQLHTYFIIYHRLHVKELCIYRQIEEGVVKRDKLYETAWKLQDDCILSLPHCKRLIEVYEAHLKALIILEQRPQENLQQFLNRYLETIQLEKQIKSLEQKINREKQSKKKFELARQLRTLQQTYNQKRG